MSPTKRPKDHQKKQLGAGARAMHAAIAESAANLVQKSLLDNLMTKCVAVLQVIQTVKDEENDEPEDGGSLQPYLKSRSALERVDEILHLTRPQIEELRKSQPLKYPSPEIEAICQRAIDEMTEVLIGGR